MRKFVATILMASLLATTASYAADAPLAPGKPAGVTQASALGTLGMITLGVVVVVGFGLLTARTSAQPTTPISGGSGTSTTAGTTP